MYQQLDVFAKHLPDHWEKNLMKIRCWPSKTSIFGQFYPQTMVSEPFVGSIDKICLGGEKYDKNEFDKHYTEQLGRSRKG